MSSLVISKYHPTSIRLASILLSIFLFFIPFDGFSNPESEHDIPKDYGILVKGSVSVPACDLTDYVRISSAKEKNGKQINLDHSVELTGDEIIEVVFQAHDAQLKFRGSDPCKAQLSAPIFLGKCVEIESLSAEYLQDKKAILIIPKDKPRLKIETDKSIVCIPEDSSSSDALIELRFTEKEIKTYTPRPIGMKPIRKKSFELLDRWLSSGDEVRVKIPIPNIDRDNSQLAIGFWTDNPGSNMEEDAYRTKITGIEPDKTAAGLYNVKARVPLLSQIQHVSPDWLSPIPPLVQMTVTVDSGNGQITSETFDLRISRRGWGIAAGLLFIFLVLLLIMYVTRDFNPFENNTARFQEWNETYKSSKFIRFFFSPMDIAVTPFGTFSISVTQAIFWTFIVSFSCVYVYTLKAAFIVIPDQILLLLGIAGGTALASRINSMSKDLVPKELLIDFQRKSIPRLRDLISIADRLNIYKFQMVIFTIITGTIVIVELIKASNFPEIPNTLITLMGLSNTLYLGNEVTVEPVQGLREKVKAYKDETDPDKKQQIGEEIKKMLSQY